MLGTPSSIIRPTFLSGSSFETFITECDNFMELFTAQLILTSTSTDFNIHCGTAGNKDSDDFSDCLHTVQYDTTLIEQLDNHTPLITRTITVRPDTPRLYFLLSESLGKPSGSRGSQNWRPLRESYKQHICLAKLYTTKIDECTRENKALQNCGCFDEEKSCSKTAQSRGWYCSTPRRFSRVLHIQSF